MSAAAAPRANAQHSARTDEHGTDPKVAELGRYVMGGIDFDPASSDYWNFHTVKARGFCDRRIDALAPSTVWGVPGVHQARVLENPPGTVTLTPEERKRAGAPAFAKRSVPRLFWERTLEEYFARRILCVFWIGFSLEQLVILQPSPIYEASSEARRVHPLQFITNVPCERLSYLQRPHTTSCAVHDAPKAAKKREREDMCNCGRSSTAPPEFGDSPTHGSYLTFLPPLDDHRLAGEMLERFVEGAGRAEMVPGALVRPHNPRSKR